MPADIQPMPCQAADHSRRGTHRQPAACCYESAAMPPGDDLPRMPPAIQAMRFRDQVHPVSGGFSGKRPPGQMVPVHHQQAVPCPQPRRLIFGQLQYFTRRYCCGSLLRFYSEGFTYKIFHPITSKSIPVRSITSLAEKGFLSATTPQPAISGGLQTFSSATIPQRGGLSATSKAA